MGKGTSTPPPPNYAAIAQQQGVANKEAAIATAKLSNPNEITPYGEKTVQYGVGGPFDQAGYDQALESYNTNLTAFNANPETFTTQGATPASWTNGPRGMRQWNPGTPGKQVSSGGVPKPGFPDRADFQSPGDPLVPTQTTTLSPENQDLYEQDLRISGGLGDIAEKGVSTVDQMLGTPFDMSKVPPPAVAGESGYARALQSIMDRNEPFQERTRERLDTQLRNQGLFPGSQAYDEQMRDLERQENDFNLGAQDRAMGLQSQQFGLDEKARQNELSQQTFLRQLPLNELNAVRSGVQIQNPQFQAYQGASVAPPPLFNAAQAQYDAALGKSNAQNASSSGLTSGLFGLGSGALMAGGMAF